MDSINITPIVKKEETPVEVVDNTTLTEKKGLKQTVKLEVDAPKDTKKEYVDMDFNDESELRGFVTKDTKSATPLDDKLRNIPVEELSEQIKREETAAGSKLTYDDMKMAAGFLIELIDALMSTSLKWWSGDSSDSAYSLSKPRKEELKNYLTMILVKYQVKFKIEVFFIIMLLISYATPVMNANKLRKANKKLNETPPVTTVKRVIVKKKEEVPVNVEETGEIKTEQETVILKDNTEITTTDVVEPPVKVLRKIRRKRGQPRKN